MPKKTTLLILILALVTLGLIFLAVREAGKNNGMQTTVVPTKRPVEKTARVFFTPQNVDLSSNPGASTVDLYVDTGGQDVSGVQAEMQFDPKAISSVKLLPAADASGFFGPSAVILFNDVNPQTGRISYVIAINAGQKPVKGVGKLATLNLQRTPGTAIKTSEIKFLNKTLVTILGDNSTVLKETMPLNIVIGSATQPVNNAPFVTTPPAQNPQTTTAPTQ